MSLDTEFRQEIQFMLERFLEGQLGVVDGADGKPKIVGIPFVCQNIVQLI